MLERTGRAPWARHWPLLLIGLTGFVAWNMDPEGWQTGRIGFWEHLLGLEVLQHRMRKMLMEERYHFLHGRSWLKSGIDAAPLNRAWQEAIEWFGPPDGETAEFHKEGRLSMGPAELRQRLEERLEARAPHAEIDWKAWDPVRRRGRRGAIDEHTFGMLRGLEEKRFAPAATTKST